MLPLPPLPEPIRLNMSPEPILANRSELSTLTSIEGSEMASSENCMSGSTSSGASVTTISSSSSGTLTGSGRSAGSMLSSCKSENRLSGCNV